MKGIRQCQGFSLIELVIVCAIISILALIAIPNFQDAEIRAKVAAVENNMRVVAMKFEVLNVDLNHYPLAGRWRWCLLFRVPYEGDKNESIRQRFRDLYEKRMYGPPYDLFEIDAMRRLGVPDLKWLATKDNFQLCNGFGFFQPQMVINALNNGCDWEDSDVTNWEKVRSMAGGWLLYSCGPDLIAESPQWAYSPLEGRKETRETGYGEKKLFREYDPTNGTVSYGNIFRTQRNPGGMGTDSQFY